MKRVVLILSSALLCAGSCPPGPHPKTTTKTGDVHLYWTFVRRAPALAAGFVTYDGEFLGSPDGTCPESGVEHVKIEVDDQLRADVPCISNGVQGTKIQGVTAGPGEFRISGVRGEVTLYSQPFTLAVLAAPAAPAAYYLNITGVRASVEIAVKLSYGTSQYFSSCDEASNPTVDFQVTDTLGALILSGTALPCSDPVSPAFTIFSGALDLGTYDIRMQGYTGAPAIRTFDSCASDTDTNLRFDHLADSVGANAITLTLHTPPACAP